MESYAFLFWAYNVVWLGLAGYLLLLFLRMRRLDRRLDGMESEMSRRATRGRDQNPDRS